MLTIDNYNRKNSVKALNELKKAEYPLYLWGAGNVADAVYQILEESGIILRGVFVDVASKVPTAFKNYDVIGLEELLRMNEKVNVIIGHAQYHRINEMEKIGNVNKVFYILNPFKTHDDITYDFYKEHCEEYNQAYALFEEEYSQRVFQAYLNTRINDELQYLLESFDAPVTYYENGVFELSKEEGYVDIGAYNGDTVEDFVRYTKGRYRYIYAFEPDLELFNELQHNIEMHQYRDIALYQVGLWNTDGKLSFVSDEGQSDRVVLESTEFTHEIEVARLDSILRNQRVTLIKSSMSAGTLEWIEGSREVISKQKPRLIINVGLTKHLLYQVPLLLNRINEQYKFFLRFNESMPSRLFLYAC